ncbi:hypothetical protein GCM10022261_15910 [Brevibacterium daeguense]|uniref:Uncharacterized protein n=1 Tax=Brevibacterium daeguense TaxID=909936 RepID=A0ABP8EJB7_9MICO
MEDADQALRDGDFAAYGEAQERLRQALEDAMSAEGADGGAAPAETEAPAEGQQPAEEQPAEEQQP